MAKYAICHLGTRVICGLTTDDAVAAAIVPPYTAIAIQNGTDLGPGGPFVLGLDLVIAPASEANVHLAFKDQEWEEELAAKARGRPAHISASVSDGN